jgi:ABC-type branched-subunit amino acid transport system ATPase component
MTPTISTTGLTRRYRGQVALDNVSLSVEPGTVTGLLGRNGAGKTTLMRIITGQEFPTAGAVQVFGRAPAENDGVLRRLVFVREEQAYPDLSVAQVIRVASWFYPTGTASWPGSCWPISPSIRAPSCCPPTSSTKWPTCWSTWCCWTMGAWCWTRPPTTSAAPR